MVNPITDPRYQLARMMRDSRAAGTSGPYVPSGPAPSTSAVSFGRAASDFVQANPTLQDRLNAISGGQTRQEPKGFMGVALGNPITKLALKPLEALALPGKATVATIREVADAFDNDPNTTASFGDIRKNIKDPRFGFGKAFKIDTGHKWLDRAIGFAGDVALDPITYASFGAGKFAMYAGRMDLAASVLKNTGEEALAAAVAREGRRALIKRPEVLERVGANKFGVYMFGKRLKVGFNKTPHRIPFTGTIGEIGEATLSKMRLAITETRLGKWMQKMTLPPDMLDARIKLAQGKLGSAAAADVIRFAQARPAQRAAVASAMEMLDKEVANIVSRDMDNGALESYRMTLHKFMENPDLIDTATNAERQGVESWRPWLNSIHDRLVEIWKTVDPEAELGKVENFFPRVMTDDAATWVRTASGSNAEDMRRIFLEDPFGNPDSFTPRSLRAGKKFFGEVLEQKDLNIESLNKIANKGGFTGDFFEVDAVSALKKYVQDAADEFGIVERNRILKETGFFKKLEEQKLVEQGIDEDAVALARQHVDELKNSVEGAARSHDRAGKNLSAVLSSEMNAVRNGAKDLREARGTVIDFLTNEQGRVLALERSIESQKRRLFSLYGAVDDIKPGVLTDSFPSTLLPVIGQYDAMAAEFRRYSEKIAEALSSDYPDLVQAEAVLNNLIKESDAASARLEEYAKSVVSSMERSNALEAMWNAVTSGSKIMGTDETRAYFGRLRSIMRTRSTTTKNVQTTQQMKALGVTENFKAWTDRPAKNSPFKTLMKEIGGSGKVKLTSSRVANMKQDEFMSIMRRSATEDVSLRELREASAFAIARDYHMYGGNIPDELLPFHDSLRTFLKDAEAAERYVAETSVRKRGGQSTLDIFENNWNKARDAALVQKADIDEFSIFLKWMGAQDGFASVLPKLRSRADKISYVTTTEFTEDIADAFVQASKVWARRYDVATPNFAFIWDYVDDPLTYIGKEAPTIQEVLDNVNLRLSAAQNIFQNEQRWALRPGKQFKAGGGTVEERLTSAQVLEKYDVERAKAGGRTKGTAQVAVSSDIVSNKPKIVGQPVMVDVGRAKMGLAGGLAKYTAMSDAVVKFHSIARILATDGIIPTENMWRDILKSTYDEFGPVFQDRVNRTVVAREAMVEVRRKFNDALAKARQASSAKTLDEWFDAGYGSDSPGKIFADVITDALSGPNGEAIREALGPNFDMMVDPYTLRLKELELRGYKLGKTSDELDEALAVYEEKLANAIAARDVRGQTTAKNEIEKIKKIREKATTNPSVIPDKSAKVASTAAYDAWMRDVLIPWAKKIDPSIRRNKTAAMKVLKSVAPEWSVEAARKNATPMSIFADERKINNWFNSLFDSKREVVDYVEHTLQSGEVVMRKVTREVTTPGMFSRILSNSMETNSFFNNLADGFLNPMEFFSSVGRTQTTPSVYGLMMRGLADDLQRTLDTSMVAEDSLLLGKELYAALTPAERARAAAIQESEKAANKAAKAQGIVASFDMMGKPVSAETLAELQGMTEQQLRAIGFTNAMIAARDKVLAHTAYISSSGYAKALSDEEIVNFLDAAAFFDLSAFDEGIVIRYNNVPIYETPRGSSAIDDIDNQINNAISTRDSIDSDYRRKRIAIDRQYRVADGSRYRSNYDRIEAKKAVARYERENASNVQRLLAQYQQRIEELELKKAYLSETTSQPVEELATQVGVRSEPEFATMPDGSRIVFSKEEAASLYESQLSPMEIKNLRARLRVLESELEQFREEAKRELGLTQIGYARARDLYSGDAPFNNVYGRELKALESPEVLRTSDRYAWSESEKKMILVEDKSVNVDKNPWTASERKAMMAEREIAAVRLRIDSNSASVRRSALEKIRVLVHGHEGQPASRPVIKDGVPTGEYFNRFDGDHMGGWGLIQQEFVTKTKGTALAPRRSRTSLKVTSWKDTPGETSAATTALSNTGQYANSNPTFRYYAGKEGYKPYSALADSGAERRQSLRFVWQNSDEFRVLQKGKELAKESQTDAYIAARKNGSMLAKAAREAEAAARQATVEYGAIESAIRENIVDMRYAEISAAVKSGATGIDWVPDNWVKAIANTGNEFKYTLNGKQYIIPPIEEVMKNPGRYVEIFSKRGDMFNELKKGGNVGNFNLLNDEARLTMGVMAFWDSYNKNMNLSIARSKANMFPTPNEFVPDTGPYSVARFESSKLMEGLSNFWVAQNGGRAQQYTNVAGVNTAQEMRDVLVAWTRDAETLSSVLKDFDRAMQIERNLMGREIAATVRELAAARKTEFDTLTELKALYGETFDPNDTIRQLNMNIAALDKQAIMFDELVKGVPNISDAGKIISTKDPDVRRKILDEMAKWSVENKEILDALSQNLFDEQDSAILWGAWVRYRLAEGRFLREQASLADAQKNLDFLSEPRTIERIIKPFEKGYKKAAKEMLDRENLSSAKFLNMPSYAVNRETKMIFKNLSRMESSATIKELSRFLGGYTGFFKAYATLTPGFHVRNAISNTFQLFAAGSEVKNMKEGLRVYKKMGEAIKRGMTTAEWVDSLSGREQQLARIATDVALSLGGGNVDDAFREFSRLRQGIITSNPATRASRKFGSKVEGSARFMLAWDSAAKGMTFNEAFSRTKRFLFDYNNPTLLDQNMRSIVPFWTWMSKNLPLQITNAWMNPKPYLVYQRLVNNFGVGEEETLPEYMQQQGGFRVGANFILSPDFPYASAQKTISDLSSPTKMLSYVNPGLRVPVELAGGKKFFTGAQFSDRPQQLSGVNKALLPLLEILGQVETDAQGNQIISDKTKYALTSLLPMVAQTERLFPADTGQDIPGRDPEAYQQAKLASYFGLPLTYAGSDTSSYEQARRLRALNELKTRLGMGEQ